MRVKRCFLMAMLMSAGLLVVADAGVFDWTTAALADHNDDPDDDNEQATDEDDDATVEKQGTGKQRCRERPNPRKCRRRRDKQERGPRTEDDRGGREDAGDPPPSGPTFTPEPEEPCILPDLDDLEDVTTVGPFVCDLYRDLTPVVP